MTDTTQAQRGSPVPFGVKVREKQPAPQGNGDEVVERGLAQYAKVAVERDQLRDRVRELETKLEATKAAFDQLEAAMNGMESRKNDALAERDRAVTERGQLKGRYETMFEMIGKILDEFVPPA